MTCPVAKPHDAAASEINGWRGRCLDLFARGERAVALALESAETNDSSVRIRHLAGQRLEDLAKLAGQEQYSTEKQARTLETLLAGWKAVDARRSFLSHGVARVLLDRHGKWHVRFDFTRYQGKGLERQQWTVSKSEADEFELLLERKFKDLSAQLGQLRKRIAA